MEHAKHTEVVSKKRGRFSAKTWLILLLNALPVLFLLSLMIGSVNIPLSSIPDIIFSPDKVKASWVYIFNNYRLAKSVAAVLSGMALGVAGLQMQTLFRNPLADPFILGINSGASLGVALVVLGTGALSGALLSGLTVLGDISLAVAASIGAGLVLGLILFVSRWVRNATTLLILGLMFGYATSALVSLLVYFSQPERVQAFTIWGYGSFGGVTWNQLRVMAPVIVIGIGMVLFLPKALNALLLGEEYAKTMGLNVKSARVLILISSSLLAGTVTAFCGPIGFLGIAVPHIARNLLRTSDHKRLIPATLLMGAIVALLADMISQLPGSHYILPLNVVTSIFGAPFVLWVILRQRRGETSFAV